MKRERWQQVEEIYNAVLERRPQDREAFLQQACAGDESVRKEVASLLACPSGVEQFIERPAIEGVAQELALDLSSGHSAALGGQTISHYRVQEKLGRGGMGIVYKALGSSSLSPSPDGKCLAASTLNLRLEPWVLDGLEPPRSFWARLFNR